MALVVKAPFQQPVPASPNQLPAEMSSLIAATPVKEAAVSTDSDYWEGELDEASPSSMTVEAVAAQPSDDGVSEDNALVPAVVEAVQGLHDRADQLTTDKSALLTAWSRYHHCSKQISNLENLASSLLKREQSEQQQQQLVSASGRVPLAQRATETTLSTAINSDCLAASNSIGATINDHEAKKVVKKPKKKRQGWSTCRKQGPRLRHGRLQQTEDNLPGKMRSRASSTSQSSESGQSTAIAPSSSTSKLPVRREISTPSWSIVDESANSSEVVVPDLDGVEDLSNAAYMKRHRRHEAAERRLAVVISKPVVCSRGRRASFGAASTSSSSGSVCGSSAASSSAGFLRRSLPNSCATLASLAAAGPANPGYAPRRFPLDKDPI